MPDQAEPPEALVQNAADAGQVRKARKRERSTRGRELHDLRVVLGTPEGRRFAWRLLGQCRVLASIYSESPTRIAYNSGQQDVGHFLMAEIDAANPEALALMRDEARKLEKQHA